MALRDSSLGLRYLYGDHLGSISVSTNSVGQRQGVQYFDAWGKRLSGSVSATDRSYTGQYLDDTGLLFYNARYYDPGIGRFVSADSIVPGNASGGMAGVAYKPLTVDFHESGFVGAVNRENQFGPWYTLSDKERQQLGSPWGPANPQALNRYSYVLNNPMKWTDPGGHWIERGDRYYGYESVCGSDGKAQCDGSNDYVDDQGKRYVRVWITNNDGTQSEKIVEEGSPEFAQFDKMLSDYLAHVIARDQAVAIYVAAMIVVAATCGAGAVPLCVAAVATAVAAQSAMVLANDKVREDEQRLRRNFVGLKEKKPPLS